MTYAESQLEPRQIDKVDRLKSVIESVDFVDVSTGKGASHGKAVARPGTAGTACLGWMR